MASQFGAGRDFLQIFLKITAHLAQNNISPNVWLECLVTASSN